MKISIQKEVLQKISDIKIGVILLKGIDNCTEYPEIKEKFQMVQEDIQKKYSKNDLQNIAELKTWEENFIKIGIDSKKYPVSIKSMLKRIIEDNAWIKSMSTLVDIYNMVSLENMMPMGAYDIDRSGDHLEIRFSKKGDRFQQLNKDEYEQIDEGELIFADENEVLCRNWVWKQSNGQKITKRTQNIIMRIDGTGKSDEDLSNVMDQLTQAFEKTIGGKSTKYILDKNNPEEVLPRHDRTEFKEKAALINEILNRGVSEINVREDLEAELWSGRKLRIKLGIDPTGFDLTLGHAVVLRKLKQFQKAGHQIVLLIGNFTAQIGDPTGKSQTRKVLTKEDVMKNAENYLSQASKVFDTSLIELVYNADWLEKMSFGDVLKLAGNFTVAQMLERDMFQDRIKNNKEINLVEFMYPLMQGYDSVPLRADIEIGGTDQLFNMMAARPIQKSNDMKPQNVLTVPILVGLDGKEKMSKSMGNYIGILDSAKDMYGKTMSIPDDIIINYFELATEVPMEEVSKIKEELKSGINPRDIKMKLAREITKLYYSEEETLKAEEEFKEIFQKGGLPEEIGEWSVVSDQWSAIEALVETTFCTSKSEARRLIEGGGVKIDNEKITDVNLVLNFEKGDKKLLQAGKRKFIYLVY